MVGVGGNRGGWLDRWLNVVVDVSDEIAVERLVRVVEHVWPRLRRYRESKLDTRRAMVALGFPMRATAYRHHPVHSDFADAVHPDNDAALASLVGALAREAEHDQRLRNRPGLEIHPSERNLVLVGSPSSEMLTRCLFGYRPDPTGKGLVLSDWSLSAHMHFRWELDPTAITEAAVVRRRVAGHGESARRNWAIADQRNETETLLRPGTDDEGKLSSDYLLITRIPNFTSEVARHSGRSIVSIGGAHGTATRAVEAVLRSEPLVRDICAAVSGHDAYQALVQVTDIRHTDSEAGTRGHAVSLVDALPVTLGEDKWCTAEASVHHALVAENWFRREP